MELDLHPLACLYGIHKGNYVTLSCAGGMISVLREGFKGYCLVFLPIILPSYSYVLCIYVSLIGPIFILNVLHIVLIVTILSVSVDVPCLCL